MVVVSKLSLIQGNIYLLGIEHRTIEQLAAQNGLLAIAAGGLGAGAMVGAALFLPRLFGDVGPLLMALTAVSVPFTLHRAFSGGLLTLKGEVRWQFVANVGGAVIQLASLIALWRMGKLSVATALYVNLAYVVCTWALTAAGLDRRRLIHVTFDRELLRSTLHQSIPLHASTVLLFLHLRADMFMVKWFAGNAALGLYSLAVPFAESILIITDSLALALNPKQVRRDLTAAAQQSLAAVRVALVLCASMASFWVIFGPTIIRSSAGVQFASAYKPLIALLPGLMFLGVQRLCGVPIVMCGRPGILAGIHAVSLCSNVALNLLLIPRFGPAGAGLASTVTYVLSALLVLQWTAQLAQMSLSHSIVPGWTDLSGLWHVLARVLKPAFRFVGNQS
jgi:O-antigen/teichoic acid export membrane protein